MKITFLGTSHGIPAKDRFCTALLVESGEKLYLIDAGAPILEWFYKKEIPYEAMKGIFISHAHSDHIGGLYSYLTRTNHRSKEASFPIYLPHPDLLELLPRFIEITDLYPYDAERLPLRLAKEGVAYEDQAIRISYIQNEHIPYSYCILLEGEGKKVLFSGDLSGGLKKKDFPAIALQEPLDAIICEMAHFDAEDIKLYLEQINVKQFWFTHINRPEEKIPKIKALQGKYPYPIHIAEDEDEILL